MGSIWGHFVKTSAKDGFGRNGFYSVRILKNGIVTIQIYVVKIIVGVGLQTDLCQKNIAITHCVFSSMLKIFWENIAS